jgi:hypothetical protein
MGFRYFRRIGGNKGLGLNVSGKGLTSSYRNKYGSIGSRGFSIKTGIAGLSFRSGWGGKKSKGSGALIYLLIIGFLFLMYVNFLIVYNAVRLLFWLLKGIFNISLSLYDKWRVRRTLKVETKDLESNKTISDVARL